jgi:hypothetical protein
MSIKSKIWSYKWCLVIGTVFFLIYISAFIFIITFRISEHQWASDLRLIIILFIGAIFGEIINKSKGVIHSFIVWISIGIYQGILFYLIYWIVFSFIIKQGLAEQSALGPIFFSIITTFGLTIYCFIPANIVGRIIAFIVRYFLIQKKSNND